MTFSGQAYRLQGGCDSAWPGGEGRSQEQELSLDPNPVQKNGAKDAITSMIAASRGRMACPLQDTRLPEHTLTAQLAYPRVDATMTGAALCYSRKKLQHTHSPGNNIPTCRR
jgi:hypothetical protein